MRNLYTMLKHIVISATIVMLLLVIGFGILSILQKHGPTVTRTFASKFGYYARGEELAA